MGYENGITGAPTPEIYPPSAWQAPTVTHQTPYETHTSFTPVSEQFHGVYAPSSSTKKKNNRASQVLVKLTLPSGPLRYFFLLFVFATTTSSGSLGVDVTRTLM